MNKLKKAMSMMKTEKVLKKLNKAALEVLRNADEE
jgi:hypothetical protein